jgi:hypothetical protein
MAYGLDASWVAAPPDLGVQAGWDEWSRTTGIPPTHALVGGPGYGPDSSGFNLGASGDARVVGGAAMPGGAPADPGLRSRWNDWRELFDPHSPMLWLLLMALAAVSLVHFRLQGRAGPASANVGLG